ncbi:MAG: CNP1-like family protein [Candidatus Sedimenticola sp. (ex Thyasira tokunagai)]
MGIEIVKKLILLLMLSLWIGSVPAREMGPVSSEEDNFYVEDYVWEERAITLPSYPKDSDLLEFDVDVADSPFRYYIDPESLSFNLEEGVVRYTLVIRSGRGGENVAYEGIRCTTSEYKVYAYGSRGRLRPTSNPKWRSVSNIGNTRYRGDLSVHYLCGRKFEVMSKEKMLQNLRYGGAPTGSIFNKR